ncbi:Hypothetical protein CAP_2800 [Chondromyces apiculatus DSM 436]|uniref:Uncharacterized protein n=2 Tax=Chondromyces apiculatus TaxID=51 RepID=A0A017T982_9BACT|nr:Hypothetical protein CAP_2800 [Chondromyces apiculatus DSM 436]
MAVEDLVRGLDGVLRDTLMKAAQHAEAAVKKRVDDFAERWKQNRRLKRAAKVKQTGSDDVQVLLQQLQEQVDDLPPEQREDAQHLTAALAHEATKPAPAKAVLKSLLAGLKEILTGADADLVAELGKKMLSA